MNQLIQDIDFALKFYPELKLVKIKGKIRVVGDIVLKHPEIGVYDKYSVSVNFSKCYPFCFPKVIEESEKIPRTAERHINSDNTLCFTVDPEERIICKNGITFKFFLEKVLIPHLSRETYRTLNGKYKDGEYSHEVEGLWEFFGNKLNITDKRSLVEEIERMLYTKWPGRNEPCYCGSGLKFKKCHLNKWDYLMVLGKDYLLNRLEILKNELIS